MGRHGPQHRGLPGRRFAGRRPHRQAQRGGGLMAVYLDYNATAPIRPEAKAAALAAMETLGNPSSVHAAGRAARAIVETARAEVAALVGVKPGSLTFTSGGTEAN